MSKTENMEQVMKFKYYAGSPSDPSKNPLGFHTKEEAEQHAATMNAALDSYPIGWNAVFWKTKPEQWKVVDNEGR